MNMNMNMHMNTNTNTNSSMSMSMNMNIAQETTMNNNTVFMNSTEARDNCGRRCVEQLGFPERVFVTGYN